MPAPSTKSLKAFYSSKPGKYLSNEIENCLTSSWTGADVKQSHLLCVGFPPPGIIKTALGGQSFVILSPQFLGPNKFTTKGLNISLVGDEAHLPFPEGSYDRVLIFHALEYMEDPRSFMEEIWKLLSPGGLVFLMVPNKKGAWKQSGLPNPELARPFLFRQVRQFLKQNGFCIIRNSGAYYGLPVDFFGTVIFSGLLKRLSGGGAVGFPGFLIFEAEKRIASLVCKPSPALKKASRKQVVPGIIPE